MPHEVHASLRAILPDDPKEMAGALGELATAWAEFLTPLSVTVETVFVVNETRTKATRAPRKPRIVQPEGQAA